MTDSVNESMKLTAKAVNDDARLTEQQITARMVAALRKAHSMPPKEQKDMTRPKPTTARRQPNDASESD
jgi:hypothetical protein